MNLDHLTPMRRKVMQCIMDLYNQRMPARKEDIARITGLKEAQVQEACDWLREFEGLIRRPAPGFYEPVGLHPASRAQTKTVLPDGTRKYEIGDFVLTLTPEESGQLGKLFEGEARSLDYYQADREHLNTIVRLEADIRKLGRVIHNMARRTPREGPQLGLFNPGKPKAVEKVGE